MEDEWQMDSKNLSSALNIVGEKQRLDSLGRGRVESPGAGRSVKEQCAVI